MSLLLTASAIREVQITVLDVNEAPAVTVTSDPTGVTFPEDTPTDDLTTALATFTAEDADTLDPWGGGC